MACRLLDGTACALARLSDHRNRSATMGSSKQAQQNPIAKVAGRVMGGSTAAGDEHPTIDAFQLASRLITNGEYLQFRHDDGGYERPEFRLSDGWNTVQVNGWKAPMYG